MAQTLTFEDLKRMKIDELREMAAGMQDDILKGHSQMNKEHLLKGICQVLKVDMHVHHQVVGIDKSAIKAQIRQLKKQRDEMIEAGDRENLHAVRRRIHHLKREMHKATV